MRRAMLSTSDATPSPLFHNHPQRHAEQIEQLSLTKVKADGAFAEVEFRRRPTNAIV
jgi:hypothetical protein